MRGGGDVQERVAQAKAKVAAEIKTTFATSYGKEISLREALSLENLHVSCNYFQ